MSMTATIGCNFCVRTQFFKLSQKTLSQPVNLQLSEGLEQVKTVAQRGWSLARNWEGVIPKSSSNRSFLIHSHLGTRVNHKETSASSLSEVGVSNTVAWQLSPSLEHFPSRYFLIKERKMLLFLWSVMFTLRRDGHYKTEKSGNSACTFKALCFTVTWDGWLYLI